MTFPADTRFIPGATTFQHAQVKSVRRRLAGGGHIPILQQPNRAGHDADAAARRGAQSGRVAGCVAWKGNS